MGLSNLFDLLTQSQQGNKPTKTLRYDGGQVLEDDNDLVHKGYIDPLYSQMSELLPEGPESLHGKTLVLAGTSKKTGYLSVDAGAAYEAGKGAGSSVDYIVNDATGTLSTPNTDVAVNYGDEGVLEVWINGVMVDSFDLGARFDEGLRESAQTGLPANSPSGKITVTKIEKYAIKLHQILNARINFAAADLVKGFNTVVLKHTGATGGDQVSQVSKFFYDTSLDNPTITGVSLSINSNAAARWLSGVKHLGSADSVKVSATGNYLYDNTYVTNPVDIYGNGLTTTTVSPTDGAVSGLSVPPVAGETMSITDKVVAIAANKCDKDVIATVRPRDVFGTYPTINTPSIKLLLSSFGVASTNTRLEMRDERNRLPLSWSDDDIATAFEAWDSESLLSNGNAQHGVLSDNVHALMFPEDDYTAYQPANVADYSAFSGDQVAKYWLLAPSPKSSIQLTLAGVAAGIGQIGAGDLNVEVKLPGQTGWLDAAKPFNGAAGVASDGDGALVGSISYSGGNAVIDVTFGGKSTYDANGRCLVRVSLRNGNRAVKSITTNW